jgi:ribosomal protein S18 acetylase RimI-like enzyme
VRDDVALAARAAAAWHGAWLAALGLRWKQTPTAWRALDPPPVIYWSAITLDAAARAEDVRDCRGTVCDSWSAVDLAAHGFDLWAEEPWFRREPAQLPAEDPPTELEIVRVSTAPEVEEFERASVSGFGGDDARVAPGSIHPASILADERMTMLTGRVDGRAVSVAMSYRTDDAVGVYGVATLPSARGRGYASALTRALVDPPLPATLSPSTVAESLYRRLGFAPVGRLRMWQRR